jgi:hypothetical protein
MAKAEICCGSNDRMDKIARGLGVEQCHIEQFPLRGGKAAATNAILTCWRWSSPSLKNSLLAIVAEATGVPELVSLKVGLATRLPLMMMRLIFMSNM